MSRHRFVRNLNIHEELEEDEHDYDMFEGITPEQQDQLDSATDAVLAVLGPNPFVREQEIREVLWDNYFDVNETSDWALGWASTCFTYQSSRQLTIVMSRGAGEAQDRKGETRSVHSPISTTPPRPWPPRRPSPPRSRSRPLPSSPPAMLPLPNPSPRSLPWPVNEPPLLGPCKNHRWPLWLPKEHHRPPV